MKNRYQRLSKEEKKEAVKEYRALSTKNDNFIHTINKMFVLGIIGLVYGCLAILTDFYFTFTTVWNFIVDGIVLIFSVFLIVQRNRFKEAAINNFLIDKEKNSKKKETKKTTKKKNK